MPELSIQDPNIVYLILLAGLWGAVTAAYLPGTGIAEIIAAVVSIAAIVLMASMPTNWLAVLAVVVGVLGFLLMPFINQRWALFAVGGLILQALGSIFMFNGVSVSLPLIAAVIAVSLLYHRYILLPVLANQRKHTVLEVEETIIGKRGRVTRNVEHGGIIVQAAGETWTARSELPLEVGDEVIVTGREGLVLTVEGIKHKREEIAS